ncbi:nuclear transport factor 2 family protein [Leptolyngbya sp. FACHB-261]|uniref:nuclear transport factor 2 family protein n=1 Tax=Leptolyngbya sp. FACHB-261 TaxID=2692806 RepID=UPI0016873701|nr:nuclear transport factor 2 family protein [Leptolyngbya sp. FACHB-261]MBD2104289.1 nuclear transport factor 2 family protein [Leptolyngbya sp. FACHB-261]
MKTENLRINQLSSKAYEWYLQYLKALDTLDIEAYGRFLAPDCSVQSNNDPAMKGKEVVMQGLAGYWTTFASLEHDLLNIYGSDSCFVLEALNHYKRNDEKTVAIRAVAFTDRNEEGLVTSVRFYTDTTPLFA